MLCGIGRGNGTTPTAIPTSGVIRYAMPGYHSDVIMAAGNFIQGSSIELSADAPIEPPYSVYFQGGLTWQHGKYGILMSLQKMVDEKIVELP